MPIRKSSDFLKIPKKVFSQTKKVKFQVSKKPKNIDFRYKVLILTSQNNVKLWISGLKTAQKYHFSIQGNYFDESKQKLIIQDSSGGSALMMMTSHIKMKQALCAAVIKHPALRPSSRGTRRRRAGCRLVYLIIVCWQILRLRKKVFQISLGYPARKKNSFSISTFSKI